MGSGCRIIHTIRLSSLDKRAMRIFHVLPIMWYIMTYGFFSGLILGGGEPYTLNLGGWGCFKITPRTLHSWPTNGWSSKIEALIVGAGDPEP